MKPSLPYSLFWQLCLSLPLAAAPDPFAELDANRDGKLVLEEIPENLKPLFPVVDANGDKEISREELNALSEKSGKASAGVEELKNIDYVGNGNPRQMLDVMVHADRATRKRPLVVFIHGGGWTAGDKENGTGTIRTIASSGDYVAATINYRFSQEATWPAQIHDCKAAIRFLRGKSDEYGIDHDHVGVMGISAGGHLVAMLGTCEEPSLEGKLGSFPGESSKVQCVVNFFGPTDFLTFFGKEVPIETLRGQNMATRMLGKTEEEIRVNARTASPVTWISKGDAPFFTAHGTRDDLVPFAQAKELDEALRRAGVESHLIVMEGGGHGFASDDLNERIRRFFALHLKGEAAEISSEPIQVR